MIFGCDAVNNVPVKPVAPLAPILVTPPNVVIFGCDAVNNVPVKPVAITLPALILPLTPAPPNTTKAPVAVVVLATAALAYNTPKCDDTPATLNELKLPTAVMFV